MTSEEYRKKLTEQIKALAADVYEMAPDLVGSTDMICNIEIKLQVGPNMAPTVLLTREHIGKKASEVL